MTSAEMGSFFSTRLLLLSTIALVLVVTVSVQWTKNRHSDFYDYFDVSVQETGMLADALWAMELDSRRSLFASLAMGTDGVVSNQQVVALLSGKRDGVAPLQKHGVAYYEFSADSLIAGCIVDRWGTPYQFAVDGDGDERIDLVELHVDSPIAVWSCGRNRRNETGQGDDVASWAPKGRYSHSNPPARRIANE